MLCGRGTITSRKTLKSPQPSSRTLVLVPARPGWKQQAAGLPSRKLGRTGHILSHQTVFKEQQKDAVKLTQIPAAAVEHQETAEWETLGWWAGMVRVCVLESAELSQLSQSILRATYKRCPSAYRY